MKSLAIQVLVIVLAVLLGSCGAGFAVSRVGGAGVVGALRDVAVIILALLYLVMVAVWAGIYFGAAWAVERFGGKGVVGLRWVRNKVMQIDAKIEQTTENTIIRPAARVDRWLAATGTFVESLTGHGPPDTSGEFRAELTGWRTRLNRVRGRVAPESVAHAARPEAPLPSA